MNNLMLDLETMGVNPGCAIVSIGAVQFDLNTGKLGEKFYTSVDLKSCVDAGLKIEPDTLMWWLKQSDQARAKLYEGISPLATALTDFATFLIRNEIDTLWGNSASFDCAILKACYLAYNKKSFDGPWTSPWNVFNEKCYRTVTKLFPANLTKKDATKAHDPIYDCEYQIANLCRIWRSLKSIV